MYKMEENIGKCINYYCIVHPHQSYELYCKNCRECVCYECLRTFHRQHVFCNLDDAEDEIRREFYINQEEYKKLNEILVCLQQKITYLEKEKNNIRLDIENHADNMKRKIDFSKEELISSLESIYEENSRSVRRVSERLQQLRSHTTKLAVKTLEEYNFIQIVDLVCKFKYGIKFVKDIDKTLHSPIFEHSNHECNVGTLSNEKAENCGDIERKTSDLNSVSDQTQTENLDEVDSDVEWFDAEDLLENESGYENSSDEFKEEYPLTIRLGGVISKIVPVSNKDAWVIEDSNLKRIKGLILENEIFAKSVDDIAVLEDGSILILNRRSTFITRLLQNKRLVQFTSVSYNPYCFCTSNKSVFIITHYPSRLFMVVEMNQDGIKSSERNLDLPTMAYRPFSMVLSESHVYVLNQCDSSNICSQRRSLIIKLHKNLVFTSFYSTAKEFSGVYGMYPAKDFMCYGFVCAGDTCLVSDNINQKIYALDKDLNFRKCILDATHGLESPGVIAIRDNLLWVSDVNKISIFILKNLDTRQTQTPKLSYCSVL